MWNLSLFIYVLFILWASGCFMDYPQFQFLNFAILQYHSTVIFMYWKLIKTFYWIENRHNEHDFEQTLGMPQTMGWQRVIHDLAIEQQQQQQIKLLSVIIWFGNSFNPIYLCPPCSKYLRNESAYLFYFWKLTVYCEETRCDKFL